MVLAGIIHNFPDDLEADVWVGFLNCEGVGVDVLGPARNWTASSWEVGAGIFVDSAPRNWDSTDLTEELVGERIGST